MQRPNYRKHPIPHVLNLQKTIHHRKGGKMKKIFRILAISLMILMLAGTSNATLISISDDIFFDDINICDFMDGHKNRCKKSIHRYAHCKSRKQLQS